MRITTQGPAPEACDFGTAVDRWGKGKNREITTRVPSDPIVETDLYYSTCIIVLVL